MLQIISGFWVSRCVYILAKLGIADLIKDQSKTAEELAAATGSHGPSLFRVLRALAAVGVITQDDQNRFGATPLSDTLRSDMRGSLRAFAMTELGEEHYPAWASCCIACARVRLLSTKHSANRCGNSSRRIQR